jgi:hypothetical protein
MDESDVDIGTGVPENAIKKDQSRALTAAQADDPAKKNLAEKKRRKEKKEKRQFKEEKRKRKERKKEHAKKQESGSSSECENRGNEKRRKVE